MTIYAVPQTTVGLAIETVRNTPVAPAVWAKVKSPAYKINQMLLEDDTLQGSMVSTYDATTGLRYDSHGWSTHAYLDVLPYYVLAELGSPDTKTAAPSNTTFAASAAAGALTISLAGSIAVNSWITIDTGAVIEAHYTTAVSGAGPYTVTLQYPLNYAHSSGAAVTGLTQHVWSLLNNGSGNSGANQPPSLTISDFDGEQWRQLSAAQQDKLSFKIVPDKQVDLSVTYDTNAATTPSPPSASFTTVQMAPGWSTYFSIGGTQLTYVESVDIDLSRGVKPIPAFTGTQGYYQMFAGPLAATGKITVIEQSGAPELTKYINGTQSSLDVSFFDRKTGLGCRIHSSNTMFKTGEVVRGKEYVQATLDFIMLPTSTDATAGGVSPVNISIGNATSATYNT